MDMEKLTIDYRTSEHLKRIADAMEEILRLVKKDMANVQKSIAEESEKNDD